MKFLCSTFGSAGDVFPMLGLAVELRARGHEVTLATNEHFAEVVTEAGVAFEPLGGATPFMPRSGARIFGIRRRRFGMSSSFYSPRSVISTRCMPRLRGRWESRTVLGSGGTSLAQEKLGIPVITLHLQPAVLWSRFAPPTVPGVVRSALAQDVAQRRRRTARA